MTEPIILLLLLGVFVFALVIGLKTKDEDKGCDFDCEHCPFPKCSQEQIEFMKNKYAKGDIENVSRK